MAAGSVWRAAGELWHGSAPKHDNRRRLRHGRPRLADTGLREVFFSPDGGSTDAADDAGDQGSVEGEFKILPVG